MAAKRHPIHPLLAWSVLMLLVLGFGAVLFLSTAPETELTPMLIHREPPVNVNAETVNEPVTMVAVGDIMMGRYVETLMERNGPNYPFDKVRDALKNADRVLANLEGPIVTNHTQTPNDSLSFSFPPQTAQTLKNNGMTTVTLANNHTLNRGQTGFEETKTYLDDAGIVHFGSPQSQDESDVLREEINGTKFAFFGFTTLYRQFNQDTAAERIRNVPTDTFTIVNMHWGNEYQTRQTAGQTALAHALIDAGADLIIGHHPHVVQPTEVYKSRLIAYSLGNFIFDQYFSPKTEKALLLRFTVTSDQFSATITPLVSHDSQPEINAEQTPEHFVLLLR